MYMRGPEAVPNPDPQAGLYIRQRQGAEVVQAPIPADQVAYQMGEAMQVSALSMLSMCCLGLCSALQLIADTILHCIVLSLFVARPEGESAATE